MIAFCVRCRAKREMKNIRPVTLKNGKQGTQGVCPVCGCRMFSNAEKKSAVTSASIDLGR